MRRIKPEQWTLEVGGLCKNPSSFNLQDIQSFPVKTRNSRMKCVECWSARAQWSGFSITELEKKVLPFPEAIGVVFHCADAYIEYLPRESLLRPETLLVHNMNGRPLTDEHGFPLRVIVPFKYGYKNPKAILKMELCFKLSGRNLEQNRPLFYGRHHPPRHRPSPGIWKKNPAVFREAR